MTLRCARRSQSVCRDRAKDSLEHHGGVDQTALKKLVELLRYVDGDYADPPTFAKVRTELGEARQPEHYLSYLTQLVWFGRGGFGKIGMPMRVSWSRNLSVTIWLLHRH